MKKIDNDLDAAIWTLDFLKDIVNESCDYRELYEKVCDALSRTLKKTPGIIKEVEKLVQELKEEYMRYVLTRP